MKQFCAFLLLIMAETVIAAPTTLKCVTSEGLEAVDLILDLDERTLRWGGNVYDIVHENETYLTAYERTSRVGGEVWVINRNTGEYQRGLVGIFFTENYEPSDKGRFGASTQSGHCRNPQF